MSSSILLSIVIPVYNEEKKDWVNFAKDSGVFKGTKL